MNNDNPFKLSNWLKSFNFAFDGIITFFKTQRNAWIHFFSAAAVLFLGYFLKVNSNEWSLLVISISIVFITEMLNTAIEFLCDFVSPETHPQIKKIKDVAAGAVLTSSIAAFVLGCIVFLPKLF